MSYAKVCLAWRSPSGMALRYLRRNGSSFEWADSGSLFDIAEAHALALRYQATHLELCA